jgi:hypothetical protein
VEKLGAGSRLERFETLAEGLVHVIEGPRRDPSTSGRLVRPAFMALGDDVNPRRITPFQRTALQAC